MKTSSPPTAHPKAALLATCIRLQEDKAAISRSAMEDVQASANEHNGAMEDKFESFRENCQIQRDLFARQLDDALTALAVLHRIDVGNAPPPVVGLGTLIETDKGGRFFIAISLGPVPDPAGGAPWLVVSKASPIGQALVGRRVGEAFTFKGEQHLVKALG